MKHFVINLSHRTDRKQSFINQAGDIDYQFVPAVYGKRVRHLLDNVWPEWVDPILNRTMNVGEIGCLLSHHALWQKCIDLNEPIVIFEDDIQLTNYDPEAVASALEDNDFVYISRRLMGEDFNDRPGYSYWLCAYGITPSMASTLINTSILQNMIPADEYVPVMLGVHPNEQINELFNPYKSIEKVMAFTPNMCEPFSRNIMGSDIETSPDDGISVVTVASDASKARILLDSCKKNNIPLTILGDGLPWLGGDMTSTGGGQKVNYLREYLINVAPETIILFVDGYDVIINDDLETILNRFLGFGCDVLFASEKTCWPDQNLAKAMEDHSDGVGYPYLNSGCFIGYAGVLREICDTIDPAADDQLFYQRQYLSNKWNIQLDHESYIFNCLSNNIAYTHIKSNGQLLNSETNCCPCILHGNGDSSYKAVFKQIADKLDYVPKDLEFVKTTFYDVLDKDMIVTSFLTPEFCERLISLAEKHAGWTPMAGDKFPAQEIRLFDIDPKLYEELEIHWAKNIAPMCEEYWYPMLHISLRDAFVMKYTLDTQKSLALHTDASLITGSVKLNDNYEGGELYFPRQDISNANIPVGEMILFPGQVTHGHQCNELTSGIKYSLTIWTSRLRGDINK